MAYEHELEVAKTIALKAGETMRKYFDGDQDEHAKSDGTPVTIADKLINHMVIESIAAQFPNDHVVGEEESTADYGMGRSWICDPIDGTAAYVVGIPTAMFSLSFVVDGIPIVAVTYEPQREQLFTAIRGEGSFCNGKKLRVSKDDMKQGRIGISADLVTEEYLAQTFMKRLLAHHKPLSVILGAVFRGGLVASGRLAGFVHPVINPYDMAGLHLIVEEAGGKVTGLKGERLDYSQNFRGAIVSNGVVHDELLALFS